MRNVLTMLSVGKDVTAFQLKNRERETENAVSIASKVTKVAALWIIAYTVMSIDFTKLVAILLFLFFVGFGKFLKDNC